MTETMRNFGMTWGKGGWLLFPFLQKSGMEAGNKLHWRVVSERMTTLASDYTVEVSPAGG